MKVAVVGGTGDFGAKLAARLVEAGQDVVVGSRDRERAQASAAEIGASGTTNAEAVGGADLVVLAVKAEAALGTASELAGAISGTPVLSVASELRFTKAGVFPGDAERSLAERTQELLNAPVVAGLHSLAAATTPTRSSSRSTSRRSSSPGARSTRARSRAHARSRASRP